ncbi:MAG: Tol-Pal system beta propeller repeat protein TolB [gamma proteobacterium symbiont of Bathyaustriella thionipta]|nr:Tol-Pal system beta propeller repeat protein TolB [gamma proteobacterium symbiont of Bathyaustriella thionipta]MCU7949702.1 Tol-Pal system beta propeller repeat protein TolB [gamma proteobacterium symbiont of Bathyaustriella thionipta]MCU7953100.1 Tol-Pal system beta propeller repeat protein TolB [gamma proteobacterium symbiont of Bathyaustriella thionipta]MCU7956290.1 Tol-Pal system beta propeller repeat protein TolB [gamma proteobacterium symbiont of Bathyaustriella thionipta]MCU7967652.1 
MQYAKLTRRVSPFLLLFFSLLFAVNSIFVNQAHAVLEVEIKGGFQSAAPIAVVPFSWSQSGKAPVDIAGVISADLARSGIFSPLNLNQLPERPTMSGSINFPRWKNSNAENLVIGQITAIGQGRFEVKFKMLDIFSGKNSIEYRYEVKQNQLRRVAHQISDQIYQKLTHTKGAFDTLIAYVIVNNDVDSKKRIYTLAVADSDGYGEQIILKSKKPIMSPVWSPNGKRLAYVSFEKNRSVIYMQELKSGQRKTIAQFKGINSAPVWSPDGKRLAMTLSKDGNSEIYVMHIASGVLQRVTNHYSIDTEPAWAPDGRSLVFTSDRAGKPQIYQVAINQKGRSGNHRRLTYDGDYNAGASFSPDGKSLVLITREQGSFRVAVLDLANRYLQVLTRSRLDESPSFAPNGKMVLYATELRGRGILEAISVDGSHSPQRLRVLSGDVREPAWSPYRH